jgi:N-dimethylarginine dimethylaminohydrolase
LATLQFDRFVALLERAGAEIVSLPDDPDTTIDSIYARDASLVSAGGVVLCQMGKPERSAEPGAQGRALSALAAPWAAVAGRIEGTGRIEGGDVIWLDDRTLAVGRGYRTNDEGIRQLRAILGTAVEVIVVPLPHWKGPGDVMHLMSLVSPVDRDLAVVYSPLLPVPFRERLLDRGMTLVETPPEEFDSMGTNVLAVAPRQCVMLAGNPQTRAALERAGASVAEYDGSEISVKGCGGPTCLTRPLLRTA